MAFYQGNTRKSYFSINLSSNGTDFSEVYNGQSSGTTANTENYDFPDQNARYIKIIGNGNSQSTWNSITETRINYNVLTSVQNIRDERMSKVTIYPNPLQGNQLTVELNSPISGSVVLNITDLDGRLVYSKPFIIEENKNNLYGMCLPKGVYVIHVVSNPLIQDKLLIVE